MKNREKKKIHLVCQAKGGVGKSFFTYLVHEKIKADNPRVAFLDLDNANRTSLGRLPKDRIQAVEVLTDEARIDREAFVLMFEGISHASTKDTFWVDMGATESIEFLHMLRHNFSPGELKSEFDALGLEVEFNVIIAGGDVYNACLKFLNELVEVNREFFRIQVRVNLGRFNRAKDADDLEQIRGLASGNILVSYFGSTSTDTSDKELLEMIKTGADIRPAELGMTTRMKYNKLLREIEM